MGAVTREEYPGWTPEQVALLDALVAWRSVCVRRGYYNRGDLAFRRTVNNHWGHVRALRYEVSNGRSNSRA